MKKGLLRIKELVSNELEDYGFYDYKETKFIETFEKYDYYKVAIKKGYKGEKEILNFKYDNTEDKIFIELGEDTYKEVELHGTKIKYFWIALLKMV